jgi:hypothetical protein
VIRIKEKLIALDPGGSTGIAVWDPTKMVIPYTQTLGPHSHHYELFVFLRESTALTFDRTRIICESFDYRKSDEQREKIEYISAEYIGIVKLYTEMNNIPLITPSAALGKGFWTNQKLKAIGMTWNTKHEADALRHLVRFVSFQAKDDVWLMKLKPSTNT